MSEGGILAEEKGELVPVIPDDAPPDYKPTQYKRKVIRKREVKFEKQVQVKVMTQQVVPCTYEKKIAVKKLVETPSFEEVEETYTDFEEVSAQRQRKIWVERKVMEDFHEKIPVKKTRIAKVPVTIVVEEEEDAEVDVPGNRLEDVYGWRIDEVEDRKIVEIDDWEIYELIPHELEGERERGETRDLGLIDSQHKNRFQGTTIYKNDEDGLMKALNDGHDIESIELDPEYVRRTDGRHATFMGGRGYTSGFKMAAGIEQYDQMGEAEAGPRPVIEHFSLVKCLAYTTRELNKARPDGLDVEEFVEQLESRWRFVDADESGLVSLEELREAVWHTEEDNAGVPMPAGKFKKDLQDIVDEIWIGCGSKAEFSIWDFVQFMLNEQLLEHIRVPPPPASCTWAHA